MRQSMAILKVEMKLVVVFLIFIIVSIDCKLSILSYLKRVGSYNNGKFVTNYYLSQRLTDYNWIGAYLFCRMNGMKLAKVRKSTDEIERIKLIVTDARVFIDTTSDFERIVLYDDGILIDVDCNSVKAEFLCQDVKDSCLTHQRSKTQPLSRQKFFRYLGDYVNANNEITKSYYISTNVRAPPDQAIKYCQRMDMILASPQSQEEFDNLQFVLRNASFDWGNAAISGYRTTDGKWTDNGDGLPYKENWSEGEPNNAKANEHCLFLKRIDATLNDDPCVGEQDIAYVTTHVRINGRIWTGVTKIGSKSWYSIVTGESNDCHIEESMDEKFSVMTVYEEMLIDANPSSQENDICQKFSLDDDIKTNNAAMVKFRFLVNNVFLLFIIHLYTNM